MSCAPSPSTSRNAPPAPIVSGRYFLPKAPLSCVKWIPAVLVTSVKVGSEPAELLRPWADAIRIAPLQMIVSAAAFRLPFDCRSGHPERSRGMKAEASRARVDTLTEILPPGHRWRPGDRLGRRKTQPTGRLQGRQD